MTETPAIVSYTSGNQVPKVESKKHKPQTDDRITEIDWLGFVRCALTENAFALLRAFVLDGVFQHQLKFKTGATHGMRRKSMNSKSEVTVRTVVIFISRPLCFFVFEAKVEY